MAIKGVTPKKKVAKKKAPAKKAPAKRSKAGAGKLTLKEREALTTKVAAILWGEFVKAAQLPVNDDCIDEAIALGALGNVRRDISNISSIQRVDFKHLKNCCVLAGNRARKLATQKGASSITRATFREAFIAVRTGMNNWSTKKGPGLKFVMFGPVCTPA